MSYTLAEVCNRVSAFASIQKEFGFFEHGNGVKPWSTRFVNVTGECYDMRGSDWTYYMGGEEIATGTSAASLRAFLQGFEEIT